MRSAYWPGSSLAAGKLKWPLSSLMTDTVMVEPAFLALTTTPSIAPSSAELTCPDRGAADCAKTWVLPTDSASASAAELASSKDRICMALSQTSVNQQGFHAALLRQSVDRALRVRKARPTSKPVSHRNVSCSIS